MKERVAIIGIGYTQLKPISPEVSFREMIYEAAVKAYNDAGIEPKDVDTFVAISEDYYEGTAIFDEYVPDQIGAVLKPVHTITQDAITALAACVMQIKTGIFKIAVLEGHSKASNIVYPSHIDAFALDPILVRPLGFNPIFLAGLEMQRFLIETGNTEYHTSLVVLKNKRNALKNPIAAYPGEISIDDVLSSNPVSLPLKELDISKKADGAFVIVLAKESIAKKLVDKPVYIEGIGWLQETPNIERRDFVNAIYLQGAANMAYREAGIKNPLEIDFAEIDDTFSYKELQHIEALGIARFGESGIMLEEGYFDFDGAIPINVSGGSLGCGNLHDANSLRGIVEAVLQLRNEAGERQIENAEIGLVASWRGIPTASGGVVILSNRE
jgi:acetyl-CoA C-acetyltransferase